MQKCIYSHRHIIEGRDPRFGLFHSWCMGTFLKVKFEVLNPTPTQSNHAIIFLSKSKKGLIQCKLMSPQMQDLCIESLDSLHIWWGSFSKWKIQNEGGEKRKKKKWNLWNRFQTLHPHDKRMILQVLITGLKGGREMTGIGIIFTECALWWY